MYLHKKSNAFFSVNLVIAVLNTKIGKANNLSETNHELASVLFTQKSKANKTEHMDMDKERKLSRMTAVRQTMLAEETKTIAVSIKTFMGLNFTEPFLN